MPPASLHCVTDASVPASSCELLRAACDARGLAFTSIDAAAFCFADPPELPAAAMMYRPAVALAAIRCEQLLMRPDVATFYRDSDALHFDGPAAPLCFQRAGLPVPRSVPLFTTDRDVLRHAVRTLGGLPVVLKTGGEGGVGVMRADSWPALFSLVDYLRSQGVAPWLQAHVPDAEHWRVVVVGERGVAGYRNDLLPDDFRSAPSDELAAYVLPPPAAVDLAVAAVRVTHREFGGVDLLRHPGGRWYLLEVNMPCYYPHAQEVAGVDIAGAMVDHLHAKALRLAAS